MARRFVVVNSPKEAVSLKNETSVFLAGGTEINRLGSTVSADTLLYIGKQEQLKTIEIAKDFVPKCNYKPSNGSFLRIGALCTFQKIIENELVPSYLKEACSFMASRTKRNMATIGGNIALRRDDSYIYPTLLACGAKLEMMDKEGNIIYKCVKMYLEKALDFKDYLILAVMLPLGECTVCSKRYANTAESHAYITLSVGFRDGQLKIGAALKNTGLYYLRDFAALFDEKMPTEEELLKAVNESSLKFEDDIFGSPEYKKYLFAVTLCDLVKKAKGGAK